MQENKAGKKQASRAYRRRLRAQGLRAIELWVPDTRASGFAEEARRQSVLAGSQGDEQQPLD